jgi:superfamily II DNA/RNA helicase
MSTATQWTETQISDRIFTITGKQPCKWQLEAVMAQLKGDDVIVVAPTGLGKTLAFIIPLLLDPKRVIILITPLNQLAIQHAQSFMALNISAISLTTCAGISEEELKVCECSSFFVNVLILLGDNKLQLSCGHPLSRSIQ